MNPIKPYQHGGSAECDLRRLGVPERPIIDFSVNLNPLGPPDIIRDRWMDLLHGVETYPSTAGGGLSSYYQQKFDLPRENVLPGNGSTEMIYLIPRVLGIKRAIVFIPSYHDYWRASRLAGAEVACCRLDPEDRFQPARDDLAGLLSQGDALWIGNPNNPTGALFPREFALDLADSYPDKWILVDEAFMPFLDDDRASLLSEARRRQNILVIHSLTKFYALPGLRLGGVIGNRDVIARLRAAKEPWTVNGVAERVAPLLLGCEEYERKGRLLIQSERTRLMDTLSAMEGLTPYPSHANFILCRWELSDNLDDLLRHMLLRGLYLRDCRNFQGLEGNYFRTAVRTTGENDQLISALSSYPG